MVLVLLHFSRLKALVKNVAKQFEWFFFFIFSSREKANVDWIRKRLMLSTVYRCQWHSKHHLLTTKAPFRVTIKLVQCKSNAAMKLIQDPDSNHRAILEMSYQKRARYRRRQVVNRDGVCGLGMVNTYWRTASRTTESHLTLSSNVNTDYSLQNLRCCVYAQRIFTWRKKIRHRFRHFRPVRILHNFT